VIEEEVKALQKELEVTRGERDGLKAEKEALAGKLENGNSKITELEAAVAERDERLSALNESLSQLNSSLSQTVSSYKAMVVKSNPGILGELITGDTIEAIDQSVKNANALIGRVKQGLEEEASRIRIPAGAPQRTLPDLSALSPREKIQYAIKRSP
jgi:chromosome segregation ATPase